MTGLDYFDIIDAFTLEKYFNGSVKGIHPSLLESAADLLRRVIGLLWHLEWQSIVVISSGYRDPEKNKAVGGAKTSYHVQAKAVDIFDPEGKLAAAITKLPLVLNVEQLWMEDPESTKDRQHVHLDTGARPYRELRIFKA